MISIIGGYDIHLGFFHLTAHGTFKPLLMMNGCFIIALMICGARKKFSESVLNPGDGRLDSPAFHKIILISLVILLALIIYYPSTGVNFDHHDWTHRHLSAEKDTILSTWQFFTTGDATGFYRPLGFISLWLDYRLFGATYEGYHVQSIALHIINSLLAAWLALTLGFGRKCSFWAGSLFAAAAVNFEAVVWPAARFDLSAATFTLLALIFAIRYFRDNRVWTWALAATILCFMLGVLNKESSYCLPLLLVFIMATRSLWSIPRLPNFKILLFLSFIVAATGLMLWARIAVYGSLGGYPTAAGAPSFHFKIDIKTFTSLIRAIPIPVLGVNTSSMVPVWGQFAPMMLVVPVLLTAFLCRGCFRRKEYALGALLLLSMAPVLNIVGWIGSWMQHSRYLYLPTVFAMLLIASAVSKVRWSGGLLGAFLFINALGAAANIRVYLNMLEKAETIAGAVYSDWKLQPDVRTICLLNLPENPDGVFYFGSEVVERIGRKIPNATVLRQDAYVSTGPDESTLLIYRWNDSNRALTIWGQSSVSP
ncbi:MAG: hypothetical protein JXA73_03205 [Acidobacteria bacterium]|nr:hypothetical protein [Acidobacteriota bacterium]